MKNKVLIIEDEILARVGLHQLLDWNALGFTLLDDAKDGQEAIRSIENEHPDILLLDLNIPKINGLQILEYHGGGTSGPVFGQYGNQRAQQPYKPVRRQGGSCKAGAAVRD